MPHTTRHMGLSLYLSLCALYLASCTFDIDEVAFEDAELAPTIALPIADAKFSLGDLLRDTDLGQYLVTDPDGALRLRYRADLFRFASASRIPIPSLAFPVTDSVNAVALDKLGYSQLTVASTELYVEVRNASAREVRLQLSSPNLLVDGVAFEQEATLRAGETFRRTRVTAQVALVPGASGQVVLSARTRYTDGTVAPSVVGVVEVRRPRFLRGVGTFQAVALALNPDSVAFPFLADALTDRVRIVGPAATFRFTNSSEVPVTLRSAGIYGFGESRVETPFLSPLDAGILLAPRPAASLADQLTVVPLDDTNGNLTAFLEAVPRGLAFDLRAILNEAGAAGPFSLAATDVITGAIDFDFPLTLRLDGLEVADTIDFDGAVLSDATEAIIVANITNGIPVAAELQVFVLERGVPVDSLTRSGGFAVPAPTIDANSRPTAPGITRLEIPLDAAFVARLTAASRILLRVRLTSPPTGLAATRPSLGDELSFRAGITFKYRL